jgi:hypothetical protein
MYDAPIKATLQDYSSCPVDDEHQRQQRLQIKLSGELDPALFAPAVVEFVNLDTGRRHRFGTLAPEIVARSFADKASE